eukprot:7477139-Pyramimonas_sp.AAC.1
MTENAYDSTGGASRDWLSSEEYTSPPHAIGSRRRNIPPPLTRLALPGASQAAEKLDRLRDVAGATL